MTWQLTGKAHIPYEARGCVCFDFKTDDEFSGYYDRADLIVCHAGIGTIINALERNIPMVLVPREVVMPEAAADQQGIVARRVEALGRGVCVTDLSQLDEVIAKAKGLRMEPYRKDTSLLDYIDGRLSELESRLSGKSLGH